ncbi:hypothetical protein N0V84_008576 [Fusarium piperis]|uniref:Uncharacterized protein n=1 Tax=Fusarium piperis TaxID=1435070 RepID=A0A9W9BM31_9HYPO|nr:hypothetical protein N0V84_008576 [Fusarium piperis]
MPESRDEKTHDSLMALSRRLEPLTGDWESSDDDDLTPSLREMCCWEKVMERNANRLRSRPEEQLYDEIEEEKTWLNGIIGKRHGNSSLACGIVAKRWIDQGIWRDEFIFGEGTKWKHEDSASVELKCKTEGDGNAFSLTGQETRSLEAGNVRGAKVQAQEREREASRPFHRFVYQVLIEREKLLETLATPPGFKISPKDPSEDSDEGLEAYYEALGPEIRKKHSEHLPDVNSKACEVVKCKWQKRGIWDDAWGGSMPGMSWKHEIPLVEFLHRT